MEQNKHKWIQFEHNSADYLHAFITLDELEKVCVDTHMTAHLLPLSASLLSNALSVELQSLLRASKMAPL